MSWRRNALIGFMILFVTIICFGTKSSSMASEDQYYIATHKEKPRLVVENGQIDLIYQGVLRYRFIRAGDKWRICSQSIWNEHDKQWESIYSSIDGEFIFMGKDSELGSTSPDSFLYADGWKPIKDRGVIGVCFFGSTELKSVRFEWTASYFFDSSDSLPYLHTEVCYKSLGSVDLGFSPKVVTRTIASSYRQSGTMAHIMAYEQSDKPALIDYGYPLIWLRSIVDGNVYNCLLIDDVDLNSSEGRYFIFNRSSKPPFYSYWLVGSMSKNNSPYFGKYYWNYRDPSTGMYPEETILYGHKDYKIRLLSLYSKGDSNLEFYRKYWAKAFDTITRLDSVEFWSKDWDKCAKGEIEEFKDSDENAGDRYVPGKGYYSAPVKDRMSHGSGNVCWHGSVELIHGMLYYTWATDKMDDFRFYYNRLMDINLPEWARNSAYNKGWINEFWIDSVGYPSWSSMWATLDFGAYNLYNCYKLTGDKTYWNLFKNLVDYVKTYQIDGRRSFGEHWNDREEQWYYLTPESAFTKIEAIPKGADPGDYPGSMSVYAYLCLLVYNETKDESYRDSAFAYIDYINSFLSHPQDFWTLCRVPKPNGFAFASLINVKRYELTKDQRYLDFAEEWAYLLLTMYHIRSENGNEIGLAHAAAFGVFDYVCVPSLETIEPMYLVSSLLKYRENPVLLRYLALADRRHLIAYPATHLDKKFIYKYIPMELIPQRESFAMYMAGAIMIENVMFHAIHSSSDAEILVACLNASETGMDIKTIRNMIIYNPLKARRSFRLFMKYLDPGNYNLVVGEGNVRQISAQELKDTGINLSLDGDQSVRIYIEKKSDY